MPKVVDRELYRKQLLEGCFKLFAERGYGRITMRQIAKGLGVSTGTLYHYFPSKESIFMQLVKELFQQDLSSFLAQPLQERTLEARLQCVMDYVLQNMPYFQKQTLLWVDFCQQAEISSEERARFLRQFWDRARESLTDYLQLTDPAMVDFLMVFLDGITLQYLYSQGMHDDEWLERQSKLTIQMILHHEQLSHSA